MSTPTVVCLEIWPEDQTDVEFSTKLLAATVHAFARIDVAFRSSTTLHTGKAAPWVKTNGAPFGDEAKHPKWGTQCPWFTPIVWSVDFEVWDVLVASARQVLAVVLLFTPVRFFCSCFQSGFVLKATYGYVMLRYTSWIWDEDMICCNVLRCPDVSCVWFDNVSEDSLIFMVAKIVLCHTNFALFVGGDCWSCSILYSAVCKRYVPLCGCAIFDTCLSGRRFRQGFGEEEFFDLFRGSPSISHVCHWWGTRLHYRLTKLSDELLSNAASHAAAGGSCLGLPGPEGQEDRSQVSWALAGGPPLDGGSRRWP